MQNQKLTIESSVTPSVVRQLLGKGLNVNVERSKVRIFDDQEYECVGANLVPERSWPDAPANHIIIGLKELPQEECKDCASQPRIEVDKRSTSSLEAVGTLKIWLRKGTNAIFTARTSISPIVIKAKADGKVRGS